MSERNVLLKNVKHPFLVGLHYSFQTADKLYFVLDYINGGEVSGWPICRDDRKEMKKGCYLKTRLKMEGGQRFLKIDVAGEVTGQRFGLGLRIEKRRRTSRQI